MVDPLRPSSAPAALGTGPGPERPTGTPALEMRGITKRYPGVVANDGIDLTVRPGEIHASELGSEQRMKTSGGAGHWIVGFLPVGASMSSADCELRPSITKRSRSSGGGEALTNLRRLANSASAS